MSDIYSQDLSSSLNSVTVHASCQIIYLYVKTHNKTGLKYLGKTVAKDPHKYKGSGTRWKLHCNVHGYDYTTDILFQSVHKHEIKEKGIYYSQLWNIVDSDDWANLKPEECDGGYCAAAFTPEANAKRSATQKGRPQHPDHTAKVAKANKGRKDPRTPEVKAQAAIKASAKLKGRKKPEGFGQKIAALRRGKTASTSARDNMRKAWTDDRKMKHVEQKKALHKTILTCPHCGAQGGKPTMMRCHFDKCSLVAPKSEKPHKMRKRSDNRPSYWILISPGGEEFKVTNMREFCRTHNINSGTMTEVSLGNRKQHKGWTVKMRGQCGDTSHEN